MRASFLLSCLLLVLIVSAPVVADSDKPATTRTIAQAKSGNKPAEDKPKGQEADVLEFVREHHPELADLLKQLKDSRPKEYQKAVRDLSRVRERLFAMRKTDDHRYDQELSIWKAQTRIQLLAAKLQMNPSEELRTQLRTALGEQIDLRSALLKHEREIVQERLKRLETQIDRLEKDRSQQIEKQLQALSKRPAAEKSKTSKPVKNKKS